MMHFERIQAGSYGGMNTHKWKAFKKIWMSIPDSWNGEKVCDPFARNCQIGHIWTNDINPETGANYHLDALEFLKIVPSDSMNIVIFDPPFSTHQNDTKYEFDGESKNIYTIPGYVKKCMKEIERILIPGGYLLKYGYNSTRHLPSLEFKKGWLINFGGNRNDVIVSLWIMNQQKLSIEMGG